jgi:predicted Ser/Thr protein kinase
MIGDFKVLEEIGRGGMGVVYKAQQVSLDRIVALKMILRGNSPSEDDVKRFRTEAQATANLCHANIVAVYEVSEHEGQHYFSMEYVDGQTLAKLTRDRENPLPVTKAAAYVKIIAEAIHAVHEHGILHRDLKPSNVLIDRSDRVRITDFGLAKRLKGDSTLTSPDQILGTLGYMPPEQAKAERDMIGRASDVYSLGATLYALLTGRPPFQAETPLETLRLVVDVEPVSPRLLNPSVPRDLETICLKCLEKQTERRYQTAQELGDELGRYQRKEPIHAKPIGRATRLWRWCQRNPAVSGLTAVVMVLVLLVAVVSTVAYVHTNAALATAEKTLKQEEGIRGAFRDSPYFKRREGVIADASEDPTIRRLLKKTIDETKDLRDKLNNPKFLHHRDREEWKRQLGEHPTRILLQQQLQLLREDHKQAEPIHNWFVLDPEGLLLAREPAEPSFIGDNFAWRTYFHGGDRDYDNFQDYLNNAAGEHVKKPDLSATLESPSAGGLLWAVSAPVLGVKDEFVGVVGLRVKIRAPDAPPAPR